MIMTDPDVMDVEPGGEVVPFRAAPVERMDLRSVLTDSWTSVVEDVAALAERIADTDFVPDEYRGKAGQIAAAILYGRELGLPPMTALATTHPIHGKPSTSAEGMRGLVQQAGHEIELVESTASRCVMRGRRRGESDWTTVAYTMDEVNRAGIRNPNYRTYPADMLVARASARLCKIKFSDVIHGLRASEELEAELEQLSPPAPEPTTTVKRRGRPPKNRAPEPAGGDETTPPAAQNRPAPPPPEPPAPPARKRAPMPTKRTSPGGAADPSPTAEGGPQPPTAAGPSVQEQQEEIRRLSEERRRLLEDTHPATGQPPGPLLTAGQRASIMMHFARLDLANDRDERLWWINKLLELEPATITSANQLTQDQAARLLTHLEKLRDREALDAILQPTLTDNP